jgi:hypothetical protein
MGSERNCADRESAWQPSPHAHLHRHAKRMRRYWVYAPEAEIALDLVGLPDIPLISFGKLQ